MQRIHAPFDEPTLAQIDEEVTKKGISRAQWLSSAICAYLRLLELTKGADPYEMAHELAQLRISNSKLQEDYDTLKSTSEEMAQSAQEVAQLRRTNESQWKENQSLKRAEEKVGAELAQLRRKVGALEEQIATAQSELERVRSALSLLENDKAHYLDTLKMRDQEIAFLQAHIAQLTQSISQLSLKPGEEEIKKRGWWQFWR